MDQHCVVEVQRAGEEHTKAVQVPRDRRDLFSCELVGEVVDSADAVEVGEDVVIEDLGQSPACVS